MSMENDPVSPHSDNQMVALFSDYGKTKNSSQNNYRVPRAILELAIKWIENELKGDFLSIEQQLNCKDLQTFQSRFSKLRIKMNSKFIMSEQTKQPLTIAYYHRLKRLGLFT